MTGLVHIAPGHGPEDFEIGQKFGLMALCPIDEGGRFTTEGGEYQGMFVKKANPVIIERLQDKGLMFHSGTVEHRYGHCWRCKSGILFRITDQWYLRVTQVKDLMLSEISRVKWVPEWAGSGREYDWTANARDWCISGRVHWGIPIPVWTCCNGHMKVVGSRDDLEGAGGTSREWTYRPWIDNVLFECEECGEEMRRVQDVLDVWFDARVASWAQLGYPRDKMEFEGGGRPSSSPRRTTRPAVGSIRSWDLPASPSIRPPTIRCWSMDGCLTARGNRCQVQGQCRREPSKVMAEFGADALRFYLLRVSAPWEDISFQNEGVKNARKMLNILWNVASFATMYMSLDNYDHLAVDEAAVKAALRPEDRWLTSRTEKLKTGDPQHRDLRPP